MSLLVALHGAYTTFKSLGSAQHKWRFIKYFGSLLLEANLFQLRNLPLGIKIVYNYYVRLPREGRLERDVCYNDELRDPRQRLDLYFPPKEYDRDSAPVVLFVHGGAWGSGSREVYALLGKELADHGMTVLVPTYRIYPFGVVDEQIRDVRDAITWAVKRYPKQNVAVYAHSAGAHLVAMAMLDSIRNGNPSDLLLRVSVAILSCGVYDIGSHYLYESWRGVSELSTMKKAIPMEKFEVFSPTRIVQQLHWQGNVIRCDLPKTTNILKIPLEGDYVARRVLGTGPKDADPSKAVEIVEPPVGSSLEVPPIVLTTSGYDSVVPFHGTLEFYRALRQTNIPCRFLCYDGVEHSDFVMDYMRHCERDHRILFYSPTAWDYVKSLFHETSVTLFDIYPTSTCERFHDHHIHPTHMRDVLRLIFSPSGTLPSGRN